MGITPNQVSVLRVAVAFGSVWLYGKNPLANLAAVGLTAGAIALDALDGHIARKRRLATPLGAQIDVLGDRMIENLYFTYFAVCGLVSLWLPVLFFARGAVTDFIRSIAARGGHSGWGQASMMQTWWGRALVASRWSRGAYAAMKCACFCYLGLQLALARGPVALVSQVSASTMGWIGTGAQALIWATAAFCLVRGLPVILEGWRYVAAYATGAGTPADGRKIAHVIAERVSG
jgi:CDP-diacylglycerol--glycerol-3-phosphate 3-phosphatidyltransferase